MKKTYFNTISSLQSTNIKNKSDLLKIKSADINILLNKVRLDKKNDFRKKIIYFLLILSVFLLTGIITFI